GGYATPSKPLSNQRAQSSGNTSVTHHGIYAGSIIVADRSTSSAHCSTSIDKHAKDTQMTTGQMRTVWTTSPAALPRWKRLLRILTRPNPSLSPLPIRSLAQVRSEPLSELWFTAAVPVNGARRPASDLDCGSFVRSESINGGPSNRGDHKPPDERTLKLGQSVATEALSSSTQPTHNTITARDCLSPYFATFVSLHPSSPTRGKGQNAIPCCIDDCTGRLGLRSSGWE
ncbi:MAG: hypothetical protein Q9198_011186, partial [Flavoplaca austrocitrina]